MKSKMIVLSKDEARWFGDNVSNSLWLFRNKHGTDYRERSSYKVLATLEVKAEQCKAVHTAFAADHDYEIDLILSSKQKRFMEGLISQVYEGLVKGVIPKYLHEIGNGVDRKPYLDRAKLKAEMLKNMRRKFK